MNLTTADLRELPLPAVALDPHDEVIAQTPEWQGFTPGSVAYHVRRNRLIVATGDANPACEIVLGRLLDAMDATARVVGEPQSMRVRMLSASLRVVAGRTNVTMGTSHDVIDFARAGITARTSLRVEVEGQPKYPVASPEVAALVLVQFAANAERHARVSTIRLQQIDNSFHVLWPGQSGNREVTTARQRVARERWGMGFARIAADTLGGAVYPPYDRGDGIVVATLELGLGRLALPLGAVQGNMVIKATRAWDEETGYTPLREIGPTSKLAATVRAARDRPGQIVVHDGWWTRYVRESQLVWVAVPPDDILDRARDVLDGIVHERALWDGVPEPHQSRVFALASLLGAMLGSPLPRVPGDTWNRKYPELAAAFAVRIEPPDFPGLGAVDPRVVAFLASEFGERFEVDGEELYLHVRADRRDDPFLGVFLQPEDNALKLS